jgi:hypothetical protein
VSPCIAEQRMSHRAFVVTDMVRKLPHKSTAWEGGGGDGCGFERGLQERKTRRRMSEAREEGEMKCGLTSRAVCLCHHQTHAPPCRLAPIHPLASRLPSPYKWVDRGRASVCELSKKNR